MADKLNQIVQAFSEMLAKQAEEQNNKMLQLIQGLQSTSSLPKFESFTPEKELFKEYFKSFETFLLANSVPITKAAQVFMTNQSPETYKSLETLAAQLNPPLDINQLSFEQTRLFMEQMYNPKTFVIRERYRFRTSCHRQPGESVQELASRIRKAATTCDFVNIADPLDEALRTNFICNIQNEAVLKTLFRIPENELNFARAVEIAEEVEGAATVAKDTVHEVLNADNTFKLQSRKGQNPLKEIGPHSSPQAGNPGANFVPHQDLVKKGVCIRCGGKDHWANKCIFKSSRCNNCGKQGYLAKVCSKKTREVVQLIKNVKGSDPLMRKVWIGNIPQLFEVDSGSRDNFCSAQVWEALGSPTLQVPSTTYRSASGDLLPVKGVFSIPVALNKEDRSTSQVFNVTDIPELNLIGRTTIVRLGIDVNRMLQEQIHILFSGEQSIQKNCENLCLEFQELFKPELGCLKDFELEIRFKPDSKPIFRKCRPVPFAILEDVNQALDTGIQKGVWIPTDFNDYGTPIVPVMKKSVPKSRIQLRI